MSAAALAPRKPLCAAAHAGASPGPGSAATAAGGRANYAAPDCRAGAGRGAKKARYHMGAFLAPSTYWRRAKPA